MIPLPWPGPGPGSGPSPGLARSAECHVSSFALAAYLRRFVRLQCNAALSRLKRARLSDVAPRHSRHQTQTITNVSLNPNTYQGQISQNLL